MTPSVVVGSVAWIIGQVLPLFVVAWAMVVAYRAGSRSGELAGLARAEEILARVEREHEEGASS